MQCVSGSGLLVGCGDMNSGCTRSRSRLCDDNSLFILLCFYSHLWYVFSTVWQLYCIVIQVRLEIIDTLAVDENVCELRVLTCFTNEFNLIGRGALVVFRFDGNSNRCTINGTINYADFATS